MSRRETFLKTVVLAGLGLMLFAKMSNGTLTFYINQRFAWLTFVALALLVAFALMLGMRLLESRRRYFAGEEEHKHDHGHDHDHGEFVDVEVAHRHGLSWAGIALIAVPMILGLVVPARPLGASAVSTTGIGSSAPIRPGTVATLQRATVGPKNILDWLRDFSHNDDPTTYTGQAVDLVGFVYKDPRNTADQFWVSRFAITCCVADASAVGLLVQTDRAKALKTDSWVHVTGKFGVGQFAGEKIPLIIPEQVEPTSQPDNPYLYP